MAKYVDCEKAQEMFNRYYHNLQGSEAQILVCDMKQAFLELPTADVQEVRHGKFELVQNGKGVCSNCHRLDSIDKLAKYCRYCGARLLFIRRSVFEK